MPTQVELESFGNLLFRVDIGDIVQLLWRRNQRPSRDKVAMIGVLRKKIRFLLRVCEFVVFLMSLAACNVIVLSLQDKREQASSWLFSSVIVAVAVIGVTPFIYFAIVYWRLFNRVLRQISYDVAPGTSEVTVSIDSRNVERIERIFGMHDIIVTRDSDPSLVENQICLKLRLATKTMGSQDDDPGEPDL